MGKIPDKTIDLSKRTAKNARHLAYKLYRWAYKPKMVVRARIDIKNVIGNRIPGDPILRFCDRLYFIPKKKAVREFIRWEFTDQKEYLKERFDCDDFARSFQASVLNYLQSNAVFGVSGEIVDRETKKHIGFHRWNLVFCMLEGKLTPFWYDPLKEEDNSFQKAESQSWPVVGNWELRARYIRD